MKSVADKFYFQVRYQITTQLKVITLVDNLVWHQVSDKIYDNQVREPIYNKLWSQRSQGSEGIKGHI